MTATTATRTRQTNVEAEILRIAAFQACGDCPEFTPRDRRRVFQDIEGEIARRRSN